MKIYCISGLGADFRMFQGLRLAQDQLVALDWIAPQLGESLPEYASRLAQGIDTKEPFGIMGLSFGGMLAVEIAKELQPAKLIVLSSAMIRSDIPWHYLAFGPIALRLVPEVLFTKVNSIVYFMFGAKTELEKQKLKRAIHQTDRAFFRWALGAILKWRNQTSVPAIRIHGNKDKILPFRKYEVDLLLDGGHLSILTHADQISAFINDSNQ